MQGPLREDATTVSTRSSVKDLYRIVQGPLSEEFIRMSTRHLLIRTCARSRKGLLEESIMIFTQDLLIKTCTRLRKDQDRDNRFAQAWATEMHMDLTKGTICARIYKQSVADQNQDNRFVRACAVKMHVSQEQIYVRIYRKISKNGPPFCASLRNRNAHVHLTRLILIMRKYAGKKPGPKNGTPFCASLRG